MSANQTAIALGVVFVAGTASAALNAIVGATFTRGEIMIGYAVIGVIAVVVWGVLAMRERARAERKRAEAIKAGLASLRDNQTGPAG